MATLPKTNLRLAYHVACTIGETYSKNGVTYLNTDVGALCTSDNINMWAKYKPVRHHFTENRPSDWWKGKMGDCGIDYDIYDNPQALINAMNTGPAYRYLRPTGGADDPYRLGDFAGYDPSATPVLIAPPFEGDYYKSDTYMNLNLIMLPDSDSRLTAQDVYGRSLDNMYFGAAFLREGYSTPMWMTTSSPGSSQQLQVPLSNFLDDEYYYGYLFICDVKRENMSANIQSGTFIALPSTKKQQIIVRSTNVLFRFENVLYQSSNNHITGQIRVVNNSPALVSYSNVMVDFRYADSTDSEPFEPDEGRIFISDFSVSPRGNKVIEFDSGRALLYNIGTRGGSVYAYANGKSQAKGSIILMPTVP